MGHLINPTSVRIGKFMYWEDFWYVEHIYYPEYLHSILKMKLYLIYFFEMSLFEDSGFLYSHFDFVHQYKLLFIRVYLYYVGFFRALGDFLFDVREHLGAEYFLNSRSKLKGKVKKKTKYSNVNSKKAIDPRVLEKHISLFSFFFIFRWFVGNFLGFERMVSWFKNLFKIFMSLDFFRLRRILFSRKFSYLHRENKLNFLFFFSILIYLCRLISNIGDYAYLNFVLEKLLVSFFAFIYLRPFFNLVESYLLMMFRFMFHYFDSVLSIRFYFVSNDGLTSKFLSRFIATRLSHGYHLKEIVNPIRDDLINTMDVLNSQALNLLDRSVEDASLKIFYKGLFRKLFFVLRSIYLKHFNLYFKANWGWLTYEIFILYNWLRKRLGFRLKSLLGFSIAYIRYKSSFFLFFDGNDSNLSGRLFSLIFPINDTYCYLEKLDSLHFWFYSLSSSFYSLYYVLFNSQDSNLEIKSISVLSIYLYRYVYHRYNVLMYNWLNISNGMNKLRLRLRRSSFDVTKQSILGFKLHISGRLSRRDRASDIHYVVGSVPANRFSAIIDYGFYSVPLRNSLIRVKVWIHRGSLALSWHLRI